MEKDDKRKVRKTSRGVKKYYTDTKCTIKMNLCVKQVREEEQDRE